MPTGEAVIELDAKKKRSSHDRVSLGHSKGLLRLQRPKYNHVQLHLSLGTHLQRADVFKLTQQSQSGLAATRLGYFCICLEHQRKPTMLGMFGPPKLQADTSLVSNARIITQNIISYPIQILLFRFKPAIKESIIPGHLARKMGDSLMLAG